MGWKKNKESSREMCEEQNKQKHLRPWSLMDQHGFKKKEVVSNAAEMSREIRTEKRSLHLITRRASVLVE